MGALVVVAHDRHILRACCDEALAGGSKTVKAISDGDLDDYRDWLREQPEPVNGDAAPSRRRDDKRAEAEERQRRQPAETATETIDAIEKELAETHLRTRCA